MIEEDHSFTCPHCGVEISVRLDANGGKRQKFMQDCEICCRPIQLEVRFEGNEVAYFSSEPGE